jgi:hypothetical protein
LRKAFRLLGRVGLWLPSRTPQGSKVARRSCLAIAITPRWASDPSERFSEMSLWNELGLLRLGAPKELVDEWLFACVAHGEMAGERELHEASAANGRWSKAYCPRDAALRSRALDSRR